MAAFVSKLSAEEREQWDGLSAEEREQLTEQWTASVDAKDETHALEVLRRILANRRNPPGAETPCRTDSAPAQSTPTDADLEQHKAERERERKATADDVRRRANAFNTESPAQRAERLEQEKRQRERQQKRPARDQRQDAEPKAEPKRADLDALARQLENATDKDETLAAVARIAWAEANHGADCPPEQIPTEAELCRWLADCPSSVATEVSERLDAVLGDPYYRGGTRAWTATAHTPAPFLATIVQYSGDVSAFGIDLVKIHNLWVEHPRPRPKHPVSPLVKAWQERPTRREPNRGSKPLLPRNLSEGRIDREAPPAPALDVAKIPGLVPYQSELFRPERGNVPGLLKTLHELEIDIPSRQPRAPLTAVLWLEGVLSIPIDARDGRLHALTFKRKELYRDWAGCDPKNWRHRSAAVQDRALGRMASITVAVGEGWYAPLIIQAVEGPHLNSEVSVLVRLPPEAQQGPAVPRRILRALISSKLAWLGFLSLCIHFDRYGATGGRLIAPTRPEVSRDEQGQILDHRGQPLRDRRGALSTRYTDARAVRTGKREPNPTARTRYPALGRDALIALFYPLDPPTSSQDERDKWKGAQRALERIESAGGIEIEEARDGWRIMPGLWSLAAHEPLSPEP